MDIALDCDCGNPECKQKLIIRRGAIFHNENNKATHWSQGYINIYGYDGQKGQGPPELMLDPETMSKLRDFLNEHWPCSR